jgi:thiol-disulfide isomerase/thioredoxin
MRFPRRIAAAASLAIAATVAAGCSAGGPAVPAGATTRAFTLPALSQGGAQISLARYNGHPVIVTFFATWCPTCQASAQTIARFYRAYHRQAPVIGVDISDPRGAGLRLVRSAQVGFPVAASPTLRTASAYGAPGLPATYFLNARHVVVYKALGPVQWQQLVTGTTLMISPPASPAP